MLCRLLLRLRPAGLALRGFQFIGQFADFFERSAVFSNVLSDFSFGRRSRSALVFDTSLKPRRIMTKAVQPMTRRHKRIDQSVKTKIAEDHSGVRISAANLLPDDLACGFASQIQALLFVQN